MKALLALQLSYNTGIIILIQYITLVNSFRLVVKVKVLVIIVNNTRLLSRLE